MRNRLFKCIGTSVLALLCTVVLTAGPVGCSSKKSCGCKVTKCDKGCAKAGAKCPGDCMKGCPKCAAECKCNCPKDCPKCTGDCPKGCKGDCTKAQGKCGPDCKVCQGKCGPDCRKPCCKKAEGSKVPG